MDIEGLGTAVSEQLVEEGLVHSAYELYGLEREQVAALERQGDKSAENLLAAIEKSKGNDLYRVIYALGIRHIGQKAAKLLADHFGSMERVMQASPEELNVIDGFGEIMAESVVQFFSLPQSRHFVEQLERAGVNMKRLGSRAGEQDRRFEGMTFVLTGTLPSMTREEASALIEKFGGKTASSVSKKTTVVLAGEGGGSKYRKAQELGIRIIDEETFKKMME